VAAIDLCHGGNEQIQALAVVDCSIDEDDDCILRKSQRTTALLLVESWRQGRWIWYVYCHWAACVPAFQPRPGSIIARSTAHGLEKRAAIARISRQGREGISFYEGVAVVKPPAAAVVASFL
jgi:hypothetical protein